MSSVGLHSSIYSSSSSRPLVSYFYDCNVGNFQYAPDHPMKPHRIRITHSLVMNCNLYKYMAIYRPKPATREEMIRFHTPDYIDFLSRVTPEIADRFSRQAQKFNVGDDCPVFKGLFDFCSLTSAGSLEAAAYINRGKCDIAINWAGGLHHAKRSEASGFCYINDIVLAILELLRYHMRVLYIDIDVHHGDGVEEAFYTTDRVMTLSFHQYGHFFPGSGNINDRGAARGRNYSLNVPLTRGITDGPYHRLFETIVTEAVRRYSPTVIVMQSGADSLAGDRIGLFNLSMRGHARCVEFVKSFRIPILLLGGGGYTVKNVARVWAYETAVAVGQENTIPQELPLSEYHPYFSPDFAFDVANDPTAVDHNTRENLDRVLERALTNLREIPHAPSVQLQQVPYNIEESFAAESAEACSPHDMSGRGDVRISKSMRDKLRVNPLEYADDLVAEDERSRKSRIYEMESYSASEE